MEHFPDGEISLQILENVRGRDVFILQTIAIDPNNYLMELLIMIDALKRASAQTLSLSSLTTDTAVKTVKISPECRLQRNLWPTFWSRQVLLASLTMDLHASQLQGFFDIPVDNLFGRQCLIEGF